MNKVLIIFAHPRLENSRVNRKLIEAIPDSENFTFHDLYENYPDFNIDVEREKSLLEAHDVIIWHHPFYWYSCPPLLKQWIDMVLEYGWAYGTGGDKLQGKWILNAITSGGNIDAYCPDGYNRYTIREFLRGFEQTARLCLMEYLPPFTVMGTHRLRPEQIDSATVEYGRILKLLGEGGISLDQLSDDKFLNSVLNN